MAYAPTSDASSARRRGLRTSKRITITLNYATYKALEERCSDEGRSISNLASLLLERSLTRDTKKGSY
jgi:hypothetical protein